MGIEVVKIHKILDFEQSRWLKPYIDFNTSKRQAATSSFEKDLFKLLNNSVYGKTMRNDRKHLNQRSACEAFDRTPHFTVFKVINEDVAFITLMKSSVFLNKPIYVAMCILNLSKLVMYDFHYNVFVETYGDRAKLLFADTDSLCYHVKTDDLYKDMEKTWTATTHPNTPAAISCSSTIMLR